MNKLIFPASALGLGAAALAGGCAIYRYTYYNPPKRPQDPYTILDGPQYRQYKDMTLALTRAFDALPYEPVTIVSDDGLRLFGRYYHLCDGAPLEIQLHGYRGAAMRDFCGGNQVAIALGHNRLVVDQRAHGKSEGCTITFGVMERQDCRAWAEYAAARFGSEVPIILTGISMGAATVLMASALKLPESVRCVIADCPYTTPRAIIEAVCRKYNPELAPLLPVMGPVTRLFAHFDLDGASAIAAAAETRLPILLIHGEADGFVPCDMGRAIAAAGRNVRLETFPEADHGMSYMLDPERYERVIREFLTEVL